MTLWQIQPNIHPWRLPIVGLYHNVHPAIPIDISHPRFVRLEAGCYFRGLEFALSIPQEQPHLAIRVVRIGPILSPLRHFSTKDIHVSILIEVGDYQAVSVNYIATYQIMTNPRFGFLRVAFQFIPLQPSQRVAVDQCDLKPSITV